MKLLLIEKSIRKNTVQECIDEINNVLEDTQEKLSKLIEDIGLAAILPEGWENSGFTIEQLGTDGIERMKKIVGGAANGAVVVPFVVSYAFCRAATINAAKAAISAITNAINVSTKLANVVLGLVFAASIVVVDAVASAITGAIERKDLEKGIELLETLKAAVDKPLKDAAGKLGVIKQSIDDGIYMLDDTHVLFKMPDGSYVVIDMAAKALKGNWLLTAQSLEGAEGILFLSA